MRACLRYLGYVALHHKAYEEAEKLFSEALEVFKGYGARLGVAETQLGLAELLFEKGEADRAATLLDEVLAEYKAIECRIGVAQASMLLAKVHKENPTRAAQCLKEAEAIYTYLGNSTELAVCHSLMSSLKIDSSSIPPPSNLM